MLSSCLDETEPMGSSITTEQKARVEAAILTTGVGLDAWMNNYNTVGNGNHWDFGYPALMLQRDLMGSDIAYIAVYNQFGTWYNISTGLGPDYTNCQFPWRWYYKWAFNANELITLVPDPDNASPEVLAALGKAYFYRAIVYFDLARLYLNGSYVNNPGGLTVPRVTEETVDVANNPRLTALELYPMILADLEKAALYLKEAPTMAKNIPSLAATNGLFARVYLEIGNWVEAEKYAKLAQSGFTPLTQAQWLDRQSGFNTPNNNNSWIWCTTVTSNNDVVQTGICNWTSFMCPEQYYGYAGPGMDAFCIDRHLYDLIPETDFRKKSYKKPGATAAEIESDYPDATQIRDYSTLKFRPGQGNFEDYSVASATSVPLMRVEEMMLIEAEAAARQSSDGSRGKQLLENFVKTYRDPTYVSTGSSSDLIVNEIWVQRRIELWGEGFSTFDIKRLNKGITRSYTGTNHPVSRRYNTSTSPTWMNYCIVRTEFNNNFSINPDENNPAPVTPPDSDPAW
jgi:tetratricopeptide (TPR) repeat protein